MRYAMLCRILEVIHMAYADDERKRAGDRRLNLLRFSYDSEFEKTFSIAILKSERKRSYIIISITALLAAWFIIIRFFLSGFFPRTATLEWHGLDFYTWLSLLFAAIALYEAFFAGVLTGFIRKERNFPPPPRYVNALIEVSMPTLLLWFASKVIEPEAALALPIVLFYFVFIALSAMRMNISISLFTGIAASLELLVLSFYLLSIAGDAAAGDPYLSPGFIVARSGVVLLTGAVTGLVAAQTRRRLIGSFRAAEERNRIVGIFGQHVSPEVVDALIAKGHETEGDIRRVCVMFLDIRGFTALSEGMSPAGVIGYLNALFPFMIQCVNRNGGIINKFLGDGFMAVFGAPIASPRDEENAVRASMEIIAGLSGLVAAAGLPPTRIGIGLHSGDAMTGTVGSEERREYTVIGDTVNVASRIEQLNKQHGSTLLASESVIQRMQPPPTGAADLGPVEIRGLTRPLRVYRLA